MTHNFTDLISLSISSLKCYKNVGNPGKKNREKIIIVLRIIAIQIVILLSPNYYNSFILDLNYF